MNKNLKKNASGYYDLTAYEAITHADSKAKANDVRFYKLLHTIFHVCELAGFEIQGRITFIDRKSGKVWR